MQSSELQEILATYVQHRFAQANGSTNTSSVAFHALVLPSKHY